jgi:hypothetical protein
MRCLATTAVVGGVILAGAGVAAADTGRPTGGTGSGRPTGGTGSDQPTCQPGNIDLTPDCFLSPHGGRLL